MPVFLLMGFLFLIYIFRWVVVAITGLFAAASGGFFVGLGMALLTYLVIKIAAFLFLGAVMAKMKQFDDSLNQGK